MNTKVSLALARLNSILPLAANHETLEPDAALIHHAILQAYAQTGRAPQADTLSALNTDSETILLHLQALDLIVLEDNGAIRGAYPFTSEARIHRVTIGKHSVHCMCALDALAISPMMNLPTLVHSECLLTAAPVVIEQSVLKILNSQQCADIFFAIDWGKASNNISCADSLCLQMNFISGAARANAWQLQAEQHEIFTLADAVDFAARFFLPLMREPQAA